MSARSERKVTMGITFHVDMPDDEAEAEKFADAVSATIIQTLTESFRGYAPLHRLDPDMVATQSFTDDGWNDEVID